MTKAPVHDILSPLQMYNEVMEDALKRSKTVLSYVESVWILMMSGE